MKSEKEIVKALKCCSEGWICEECPYQYLRPFTDDFDCAPELAKDVLEMMKNHGVTVDE